METQPVCGLSLFLDTSCWLALVNVVALVSLWLQHYVVLSSQPPVLH